MVVLRNSGPSEILGQLSGAELDTGAFSSSPGDPGQPELRTAAECTAQ